MPTYAELNKPLPAPRPEPGATVVPTQRLAMAALFAEPGNMTAGATTTSLMAIIRAAETGDTRDLFALYRDVILTGSHVQAEFSKRKRAVLAEVEEITAAGPTPDDARAAEAVRWAIDHCENWLDGLGHMLDSGLWPVSVTEKIYEPAAANALGLRFRLKSFEPVAHWLQCHMPLRTSGAMDPVWEPELRIFNTTDGNVNWSGADAYHVEPVRHVVHRGHMLGTRDCFGGPMRALVFWNYLIGVGRDCFARYMERYGAPFPVGKTDANDTASVNLLKTAFALSTKLGGLVVDNDTQVELLAAATGDGSAAFERFLNVCNREISKVVLGETLSGTADAGGLGSGNADLHGRVMDTGTVFDQRKLRQTLMRQVFKDFLLINGLRGAVPTITWGGLDAADAKAQGSLLVDLSNAGLEPTDEALPAIGEKVGFQLQRKVAPAPGIGLNALSAAIPHSAFRIPHLPDPTDGIAAARATALAAAFKGALAPIRLAILQAETPEQALANVTALYPDWRPGRAAELVDEALQVCAAAGAAVTPPKRL